MEKIAPMGKKIILPALLVIIAAFAGWYFLAGDQAEIINLDIIAGGEPLGQDILILASKLETLSIKTEIFSSALFSSLQDLNSALLPEPQGRPNPFGTIGNDSGGVITSLSTTPSVPRR